DWSRPFSCRFPSTTVFRPEQPTHALVAWDAGKTTFRNEFFDEYKGGRQSTPSEFREQMPFFNVLLDAFGVAHYELTNYEADDIIDRKSTRLNSSHVSSSYS